MSSSQLIDRPDLSSSAFLVNQHWLMFVLVILISR